MRRHMSHDSEGSWTDDDVEPLRAKIDRVRKGRK